MIDIADEAITLVKGRISGFEIFCESHYLTNRLLAADAALRRRYVFWCYTQTLLAAYAALRLKPKSGMSMKVNGRLCGFEIVLKSFNIDGLVTGRISGFENGLPLVSIATLVIGR